MNEYDRIVTKIADAENDIFLAELVVNNLCRVSDGDDTFIDTDNDAVIGGNLSIIFSDTDGVDLGFFDLSVLTGDEISEITNIIINGLQRMRDENSARKSKLEEIDKLLLTV